ncbi:MAG TPA: c-type cytochrome [Flavitalea sp.]|nr:c-type cytochrome [Flavitalea sp.]
MLSLNRCYILFAALVVAVYLFVQASACKLNRNDSVDAMPTEHKKSGKTNLSINPNEPTQQATAMGTGNATAVGPDYFVCRDSTDCLEESAMLKWLRIEGAVKPVEPRPNPKNTTRPYDTMARKDAALDVANTDPVKRGLELMLGSDCGICHTQTVKLIGPPYTEIAKRYAGDRRMLTILADKIINGGTGSWGKVPMTPHHDLTPGDAKLIVQYILTLNE